MTTTAQWWINGSDGEPQGPIDLEAARSWILSGSLTSDQLVCRVGDTSWKAAHQDEHLAPILQSLMPKPLPKGSFSLPITSAEGGRSIGCLSLLTVPIVVAVCAILLGYVPYVSNSTILSWGLVSALALAIVIAYIFAPKQKVDRSLGFDPTTKEIVEIRSGQVIPRRIGSFCDVENIGLTAIGPSDGTIRIFWLTLTMIGGESFTAGMKLPSPTSQPLDDKYVPPEFQHVATTIGRPFDTWQRESQAIPCVIG